ncbi:hypothetical protein Hanom_Chr12g01108851 [Helianthus anomalus]
MKMARFQTLWIHMRKNKPLDESRKTGQTSGTKMAFYSNNNNNYIIIIITTEQSNTTHKLYTITYLVQLVKLCFPIE